MTPARPKKGNEPKTVKTYDRKSLTPSKKPTSGPNVVNKLTAGPSTSKMDKKAMVKKEAAAANRKGSYVDNSGLSKYLGSPAPTPPSESASDKKARRLAEFSAYNKAQVPSKKQPAPYVPAMKKGGMCKTKKYARGGGIEVRGKTKGKMI